MGIHTKEIKMTKEVLFLIIIAAFLTMAANLMMRHGLLRVGGAVLDERGVPGLVWSLARQWTFVVGFLSYGLAAIVWFKVLSIAEVSSSYPILVGLTFILVTVGAVLWFRESINAIKILGIAVILAGIVLVAKS